MNYHQIVSSQSIAYPQYEGKGRPTKDAAIKETNWQITAQIKPNAAKISQRIEQKSCFVLGTNASEEIIRDEAILYRYKEQSTVERGFRFLKDPLFFVSLLFIKKRAGLKHY